MYCVKCGAQVADDLRFCPNCGHALGTPVPPAAATPSPWTPPVGVKAQTGRWISAGWRMVTADLGNFILMAIVFSALASVGSIFTQGPLMVGFQIFCMKKLMNRP